MNRFWRGMMMGVLLGTAVGIWLGPQINADTRDSLMHAARDLAGRAERVWHRGKSEVQEAMRK